MPLYDQSEILSVSQSLAPKAYTATTNGSTVSLSDYESVMVTFAAGTITDGTHTPTVQYSTDNAGTWNTIANADLVGSLSNITTNSTQTVGWIGIATDVRAVTTVSGATSGGVYTATVTRGNKGTE